MRKEQIVVGNAYVDEDGRVIREVIEDVDARHVRFNAFDLQTGRLAPTRHHLSEKRQFARWAHREASVSEKALIHPYQRTARQADAEQAIHGRHDIAAARELIDSSPGHHTFPQFK